MADEHQALREACETGLGFSDADETQRVAFWALAEIDRLAEQANGAALLADECERLADENARLREALERANTAIEDAYQWALLSQDEDFPSFHALAVRMREAQGEVAALEGERP